MPKPLTPDEIVRAIDDVIEGNQPLDRWDYLVSVRHQDPLAKLWGAKCRDVENEFRVPGSHELISAAGIEKLKLLRAELVESSQT